MANANAALEDSDSSDEDYIPDEKETKQLPSEEESDGDEEDFVSNNDTLNVHPKRRRVSKETKAHSPVSASSQAEDTPQSTEQQKKRTDALWADFMKDTGFKKRPSTVANCTAISEEKSTSVEPEKHTEIVQFAGEDVVIEREVIDSKSSDTTAQKANNRRASGLGSVLNQLNKKRKIGVLEKTKHDWEKFKSEENLQDELQAYSKSKSGYLDRQDFLQRADVRRFEIEKGMRTSLRSNNTNAQ